jgi:hypothetical protein
MPDSAMESPYELGGANPRVRLAQSEAILRRAHESLKLKNAEVFLTFEPSPQVIVEGSGESRDARAVRWGLEGWRATEFASPGVAARGELFH